MTESVATPEIWSADRLMGKQVSFKGLATEGEDGAVASGEAPSSPRRRKSKVEVAKLDPMLWGRPGHLTDSEVEVFVSDYRTQYLMHLACMTCVTCATWNKRRPMMMESRKNERSGV